MLGVDWLVYGLGQQTVAAGRWTRLPMDDICVNTVLIVEHQGNYPNCGCFQAHLWHGHSTLLWLSSAIMLHPARRRALPKDGDLTRTAADWIWCASQALAHLMDNSIKIPVLG